jgi:hypothetical protein
MKTIRVSQQFLDMVKQEHHQYESLEDTLIRLLGWQERFPGRFGREEPDE